MLLRNIRKGDKLLIWEPGFNQTSHYTAKTVTVENIRFGIDPQFMWVEYSWLDRFGKKLKTKIECLKADMDLSSEHSLTQTVR